MKRKLPLLAALGGLVALVVVGVALATTFNPSGTYTSIAGTNLHQTPPISNTSITPSCTAAELAALPPGGVLWHFVLTQTTDLNTGVLRADFQTAGLTDPDVAYSALNGGNPQWNIITPSADTLLNASTDAVGDQLNLSHVCYVAKASPSIVTTPDDGGGTTGDTLNDTATLSNGNAPTGTITFKLFSPSDTTCSNTPVYTDVVTVNGNGNYDTSSGNNPGGYVALVKGTYNWTADYSGDGANFSASSGCGEEALVVEAATPDIETAIHLGKSADETTPNVVGGTTHVALGSFVHDSATATGGPSTPEGTIAFTFYNTIDCTDTGVAAGSVSLDSNGVAHPSSDEGALAAGSYAFKAFYTSSDTDKWQNNESLCEPLTVDKAQLTIVTQIHDASHNNVGGATHVPLGSVVHDTATVTGAVPGFDPTGAISFTLNSNAVANADPAETGFTASTVDSDPLGAGSYTYAATVAGDSNYIGDTSDDEPLTVDKAQLTIVTQIHNASHTDITGTTVPVGTIVHDTATVTGAVSGFPIPAVSFTLNGAAVTNADPAETGYTASTVDSAPLTGGSYVYVATVAGSDDYLGATSADEKLSVRTFGYTMGFWGNTNGQALLAANNAFSPGVALGISGGCYVQVNSASKSKTILPSTLNGITLTGCSNSLDSKINVGSFNTLLAQTLALNYNILYKSGYAGQTIGGMGLASSIPTVFATGYSLTAGSTVEDVLAYANVLIGNAKASYGLTITQTMIGQLNLLLGQLNAES